MNEKTVLVIDDSATIRRFVDNELSSAGYRVVMAPTAEDGITKASEEQPDLIILDHQLPGTTGYEVCCQLLDIPELARIPVVASSTLRKKAYAEYVDCDNVVDMLPKPYRPEALIATVENAIATAEMVVQSQNQGSAVPEVIDELGEADLAGTFACFTLREVIDMLNNGSKSGALEVENRRFRICVYVDKGRIQAVTGTGIDANEIARYMPDSLSELAPVMKFTLSGRRGSEVDGLVDLLDNKVLDPRLLRKLLRVQAALLLKFCFSAEPLQFRFDQGRLAAPLYRKLPLDCSLLALLVEGSLTCDADDVPELTPDTVFARRAIRGQNLDRAGLSSQHMKLMSSLSEPASLEQLVQRLNWPLDEVQRVLHGFELADLVEQRAVQKHTEVAVVSNDNQLNVKLGNLFHSNSDQYVGKLVRDWLAAGLLMRRQRPHVLVVELNGEAAWQQLAKFRTEAAPMLTGVTFVGVRTADATEPPGEVPTDLLDVLLDSDCSEEQLMTAFESCREGAAVAEHATAVTANDSDQTLDVNATAEV